MVSPLWKACTDGDLQKVLELFAEPSAVDIELKDHNGATPLIEAVRNGHIEVVRVLLDNGADPTNASKQGRPDTYTSDAAILDLLQAAQNKQVPNGAPPPPPPHPNFIPDGSADPKQFYPPPPDAYTYFPTINPSLSTVNEAGAYYPPPRAPDGPNGFGHLPPPEVARMIPCRYFPACRYGAQCIFAHPQGPYFQGPMPPAQFPPYDPIANPFVPQYYPPPPASYQSPNGHPISPPPGPVLHTRSPSEVISPQAAHFSPHGGPPPVPYSHPTAYGHPGPLPVPIPVPPQHTQPTQPLPDTQAPPNLYNTSTSPVPPFPPAQEGLFPPQGPPPNTAYPDPSAIPQPQAETPQTENFTAHPNHLNGIGHHRRGSTRRPSFGARRPPCAFFPAGKCKNGDDCRFPHILPDSVGAANAPSFPVARNNVARPPRGPPHVNGVNGFSNTLENKLNNLSLRDDQVRPRNGTEPNRIADPGLRPAKFQPGLKHQGGVNGFHSQKRPTPQKPQQRVPNADEFPVLAGATTPPKMTNGHTGPTAAQVLQAPPPVKKDGSTKESSTRGTTPDPVRNISKENKPEVNGIHDVPTSAAETPAAPTNQANRHPVLSFAAVATGGTAEVAKEVSVSA